MTSDEFSENPFLVGINETRSSWGWFLVAGIALIVLGAICIIYNVTATTASVVVFGWLLLIAGVFALVQAFRIHTWTGFFLYLLSALLRGCTGYLLVRYPDVGSAGFTLVLASFFIVGGIFRATGAATVRFPQWGWALTSGVLSFILGVILLVQWPVSSIWFVGFAIGVDMIFDGVSLVALGNAIHKLPAFPELKPRHA